MPHRHSIYKLIVALTNKIYIYILLCFLKTIELKNVVFYPNIVHLLTYAKRNGECSSFRCMHSEVHCRFTHGC